MNINSRKELEQIIVTSHMCFIKLLCLVVFKFCCRDHWQMQNEKFRSIASYFVIHFPLLTKIFSCHFCIYLCSFIEWCSGEMKIHLHISSLICKIWGTLGEQVLKNNNIFLTATLTNKFFKIQVIWIPKCNISFWFVALSCLQLA